MGGGGAGRVGKGKDAPEASRSLQVAARPARGATVDDRGDCVAIIIMVSM